jgi:hypothetical protein
LRPVALRGETVWKLQEALDKTSHDVLVLATKRRH